MAQGEVPCPLPAFNPPQLLQLLLGVYQKSHQISNHLHNVRSITVCLIEIFAGLTEVLVRHADSETADPNFNLLQMFRNYRSKGSSMPKNAFWGNESISKVTFTINSTYKVLVPYIPSQPTFHVHAALPDLHHVPLPD